MIDFFKGFDFKGLSGVLQQRFPIMFFDDYLD
jgi:hypothetical protein